MKVYFPTLFSILMFLCPVLADQPTSVPSASTTQPVKTVSRPGPDLTNILKALQADDNGMALSKELLKICPKDFLSLSAIRFDIGTYQKNYENIESIALLLSKGKLDVYSLKYSKNFPPALLAALGKGVRPASGPMSKDEWEKGYYAVKGKEYQIAIDKTERVVACEAAEKNPSETANQPLIKPIKLNTTPFYFEPGMPSSIIADLIHAKKISKIQIRRIFEEDVMGVLDGKPFSAAYMGFSYDRNLLSFNIDHVVLSRKQAKYLLSWVKKNLPAPIVAPKTPRDPLKYLFQLKGTLKNSVLGV